MMSCYISDGLVGILESHRGKKGAYIGCMKSGEIISEEYAFFSLLCLIIVLCLSSVLVIWVLFSPCTISGISQERERE